MQRLNQGVWVVVSLLTVVLRSHNVQAQADLLTGFGGPSGFGPANQCLPPNDDDFSSSISIASVFPNGLRFFDRSHTAMFVNTNGNITFTSGVGLYTPLAFPVSTNPMIAPFWADIDTRYGGGACNTRSENTVVWYLEPTSATSPGRVIITWATGMFFEATSIGAANREKRVSLQLVLTRVGNDCGTGSDFDVEFRYNRCEWETGSAPSSGGRNGFGGIPVQAGFDAGNRRDYVEIAGSRMNGMAQRLCTMSNVGQPGIWQFHIRGGQIQCDGAGRACPIAGQQGVCGEGVTQCQGTGTTCVQVVQPVAERCDGVDSDCDGQVDEPDATPLCDAGLRCDRGRCVPACSEGFCGAGQVCSNIGTCVDAGCADITCPAGQTCRAGACADACAGVTCPRGESCRAGRCLNLCEGLSCPCGVCTNGACAAACTATSCQANETCGMNGRCVETACTTMTCEATFVCQGGACVDACTGVSCPYGHRCSEGHCIQTLTQSQEERDAGVTNNTDAAGTSLTLQTDVGVLSQATTRDGGIASVGSRSAGCKCQAGGSRLSGIYLMIALAGLIGFVQRRQRR